MGSRCTLEHALYNARSAVVSGDGLLEHYASVERFVRHSATTYWAKADEFRDNDPDVHLRPDVLNVEDGNVVTSARHSAGIDLGAQRLRCRSSERR